MSSIARVTGSAPGPLLTVSGGTGDSPITGGCGEFASWSVNAPTGFDLPTCANWPRIEVGAGAGGTAGG